jgi:endonuclease/exonuclease/phosphatase family metal-dependent hydrolase
VASRCSAGIGAAAPSERVLRVATYNIHAAVGTDRRRDLGRIAAVIEQIRPDVVGLQEVESRPSRAAHDQAERLALHLGMSCVEGPLLREGRGWYGNAILSLLPVESVARLCFAHHGGEPRGALMVAARAADGMCWQIGNTHLDLRAGPRLRQARSLVDETRRRTAGGPCVLLGDLNEWLPWARSLACLRELGVLPPAPASYPSCWPLFRLDRLVLHGCRPDKPLRRHASALARRASDHLPIVADLRPAASVGGAGVQPVAEGRRPGPALEEPAHQEGEEAAAADQQPALGARLDRAQRVGQAR